MKIEQKIKNFAAGLSIQRGKVWIVMTVVATSLLLSSCDAKDYQTDLGDPSLYKNLYNECKKETKSLSDSLNRIKDDNTRLKENNSALRQQKVKDIPLLEREKGLDQRENNISNRENQVDRDREEADNANDKIFNNSIEIGKKYGRLEKNEEIIAEYKKEVTSLNNWNKISNILSMLLGFLIAYFVFQKQGIFNSSFEDRNSPIIDVTNHSSEEKPSDAGVLEQTRFPDTKALPPENTK